MQAVSATLQAAIESPERPQALVRLRVDWARTGSYTDTIDDLSADVVSVDLNRDLTTDLPPATKLFAGAAAAEATITLAHNDPGGDSAKHGAFYYSPVNSASPLFGFKRRGAPAILEFGFVTAAGPEFLTVLTGSVRSLQVTSGGRVAVMRVADSSETMRRQVTLPMVIADGETSSGNIIRPNLNTTFLADWVARKCGYYASPPPRASCLLSATHHGSGYPEVGAIQHHNGEFGSKLSYSPTPQFPTAARFVQAVNTDGSAGQEITYILSAAGGTASTNNGGEFLWEGWRKFNTVGSDQPLFIAYVTGAASPYVSAFWQASTSRFTFTCQRSPATAQETTGTSGPSVSPGTSSWHYWAVQVSFTSTQIQVTFRFDATTSGPVNIASSTVTGQPALNTVGVARGKTSAFASDWFNGLSEADQVTAESATTTWNNAYVPNAEIHASQNIDNRLVATPAAVEEGWTLFQQIAASEFATAGFTEDGRLFYWPRDRWTQSPYTTSQRTLTAAAALKELETVEAIDQVRNRVVLRSQVPEVLDSSTVWKLGSRVKLTAGQTRTIWVSLNQPVGNVDTSIVYGTALGSSRYLAGTQLDGQGDQVSNLTFAVSVLSPTSIKITVTNPNGFTVYLAGDENASTVYAGRPYLWVDAQIVNFAQENTSSRERAEATDATSITNYGEQLLELEDSDFRQDTDDIQQIADDLVADLGDPGPALSEVPIVGDPRLQLGDRVTIIDPAGLAMNDDFHLSSCDLSFEGGALDGVISLRSA